MKKPLCILIVADNSADAAVWADFMTSSTPSVDVRIAASIEQAEQFLLSAHVDLIVAEYDLVDGQGACFLKEQDDRGQALLPVVIVMQSYDKRIAASCFQAGALDVFEKKELHPENWPWMVRHVRHIWKLTQSGRRHEQALTECRNRLESQVEKRTTDLKKYVETLQQESEERKLVVEALRESEMMYRTLFESAPVGIALAYINGSVFGTNDAMIRMAGYERAEDRDSLNLSHLFQDQANYQQLIERVQKEKGIRDVEVKCRKRNHSLFDAIISMTHLSLGGDEFLLTVFQDISERKQAEEKLHLYAEQLKEMNAELYQYDYAVAHDIRAPLRAIRNYADFLLEDLEGKLEGPQEVYLQNLGQSVMDAEQFVSDLLELSRIGRKTTGVETLQTDAFVKDLVKTLHFSDDVSIEFKDRWPSIDVEPTLFRQVFLNLMTNAVKFNDKDKKEITLGCAPALPDLVEFYIKDNGIGIDEKYHSQIFRVFERLHTTQEYEGTGIGLAIVKKAVNRMQGRLRLESRDGEGTTFYIALPCCPAEERE